MRGRDDVLHDQAGVRDRHDPCAAGADFVDGLRMGHGVVRLQMQSELFELR